MRTPFLSLSITLLFALLSTVSSKGQGAGLLHLEKEIPLPGVEGRIDHFSADVPGQRLFVAALANGSVEVLDVRQGKRTAEIKGLKEPQGVFYEAKTGRLYVASGGDGKLHIYEAKSLTEQAILEFGDDADNVRYDQQSGNIWVGYGNGGIGIVNAAGQRVDSVALGTHPESFQFGESEDRVYVNGPKQFGVTVIDRQKRAVVAKWGLGGSLANYPMAIDSAGKRLFVGCRFPGRLVVLDATSGRIVAVLVTVGDTDDVFFDDSRRLVYVIGGEGAVEILRQRDPDHYDRIGRISTAPGARTGLYIPSLDRLFVGVPHRGSQPAKVLVYEIAAGGTSLRNANQSSSRLPQ
jgi:DNA-binding beta-propeller fold protein YncE